MINRPSAGTIATTTYVVRFWREWSETESRWRGRIEHVQSRQRQDFLYLDDMLCFLRRMGVIFAQRMVDDEHDSSASQEPA